MNADLKAKWIAALRSGDFKQTQRRLKGEGAYCCLGVLAVVHDPNVNLSGEYEGDDSTYMMLDRIVGNISTRTALVRLNDTDLKTFPEIADWIEENIPALPNGERP